MALTKNVSVELRPETWPSASPPKALVAAAASSYRIDVLCALMFTALWTRPPVWHGFSLSDTWAWLRYFPAISPNPELRLCEPWTSSDPHQKTILSSDFGVGFTTWFLNRCLGFTHYADVLWVVNTLRPDLFELTTSSKVGPKKSPDYIATDGIGSINVVECKGTQSSRRGLLDAINRGIPQKENLQCVGSAQFDHSLVAGLFVPQFESAEGPTLIVADPDWDDIRGQLRQFSREQIGRGVSQIAYAKELSTLDLAHSANSLARGRGSMDSPSSAFARDSSVRRPDRLEGNQRIAIQHDYVWAEPTNISEAHVITGARFEAHMPAEEVEKVRTAKSPEELGERKRDESLGRNWVAEVTPISAELTSPMGNTFRLTLFEA